METVVKGRAEANLYGEYTRVVGEARREGWLVALVAAHATPCTQAEAVAMISKAAGGSVPTRFRKGSRGRANARRIVLPAEPGGRIGHLRSGIVLHEVAHTILMRRTFPVRGHGPEFKDLLRTLVRGWWSGRKMMDFRPTYDRHVGPYSLVITLEGGKSLVRGPFVTAESVEAEAKRVFAEDRRALAASVFSDHLRYFIGVTYDEDNVGVAAIGTEAPAAPVEQPLPVEAPAAKPERLAAGRPGLPRKHGSTLELDPGNAEAWPQSKAAQLVRQRLTDGPAATASALAAELGPALNELGVAHPAALISRLKQAGLLRVKED